jgi:hypothetical protein
VPLVCIRRCRPNGTCLHAGIVYRYADADENVNFIAVRGGNNCNTHVYHEDRPTANLSNLSIPLSLSLSLSLFLSLALSCSLSLSLSLSAVGLPLKKFICLSISNGNWHQLLQHRRWSLRADRVTIFISSGGGEGERERERERGRKRERVGVCVVHGAVHIARTQLVKK